MEDSGPLPKAEDGGWVENIMLGTDCLLYTSTDDPSRTATYEAVNLAKSSGALISYDPNYRAALWSDAETVSYTHLDVYKRQLVGERKIPMVLALEIRFFSILCSSSRLSLLTAV